METMSNECTFWILQVKETAVPVRPAPSWLVTGD